VNYISYGLNRLSIVQHKTSLNKRINDGHRVEVEVPVKAVDSEDEDEEPSGMVPGGYGDCELVRGSSQGWCLACDDAL
jgi:hypothetical protein